MSTTNRGPTTTSVQGIPAFGAAAEPTPGLVLIYSRLHPHLPSALPFAAPAITIGRESDNTLSVPETAVSRYHARIERRTDGHFWVVDTQSTNGTFINGRRVREHPLSRHAVLRVGDTLFRFADQGIYSYGAYRLDGSVIQQARPFHHGIAQSSLVGGCLIDAVLDRIDKVATSNISVVVTGESGTGKELVAREVHRLSGRRGAFQAINCAALPANLIESELFGFRRGAFSGAHADKAGLVKTAHGGSLFLDEVGDMPLDAQAKLLRVLQEREVLPLGATTPEHVDVRVVCATHRDLEARVSSGLFRGDLLARLRELSVHLPPLRERREDLFPLLRHFLRVLGTPDLPMSFPFMLAVAHHGWPYNVRELESAVRVAVTLSAGAPLDLQHLPETVRRALDGHGSPMDDGEPARAELQGPSTAKVGGAALDAPSANALRPSPPRRPETPSEAELRELLFRHRGNIAAVARELGKERMQVHRWLRRYNIEIKPYRQ